MAWVVWVDDKTEAGGRYAGFGQAIGPFAKEADADARAEEEVRARAHGTKVQVTFLVYPHWVVPGERWMVPMEIVVADKVTGQIRVHRPRGDIDAYDLISGNFTINLDDL
jgi:hypothetical protein